MKVTIQKTAKKGSGCSETIQLAFAHTQMTLPLAVRYLFSHITSITKTGRLA